MTGRKSGARRFNTYKFSEILWLRSMEKVISKRYHFIVDALFYFEPLQRFEYMSGMFSFGVLDTERARKFFSNWRREFFFRQV